MSFSKQGSSSFTPYQGPKSVSNSDQSMQLSEFGRLSLNSQRSNVSLGTPRLPLHDPSSSDLFSLRDRNRSNSVSLELRDSLPGNNTFLNHSLVGKSSVYRDRDEFHLYDLHYQKDDDFSERSCPVGHEEAHIDKFHHPIVEESFVKQKTRKRFEKTKNLLRTISSYFHKFLKYNVKAKDMVFRYLEKKEPEISKDEKEQYFRSFMEWVSTLNMTNFQEYQKAWQTDHKFKSIYRQLCFKYYRQQAYCDIQNSRLTIKSISTQYLYQLVEGLMNPTQFTQFR